MIFSKVICPNSHAKTVFEVTAFSIDNETDDDDAPQSTEADWVKGFVFCGENEV